MQELSPLAGWSRYDRWIQPLADVVFDPESHAGRPVYLDLEPEVLARLGEHLGLEASSVVDELAADVASVCDTHSTHAFEALLRRHLRWRRTDVRAVPPTLPLLAVFSLAAEQMGGADGINQANYYARLLRLLPGDLHNVATSYRDVAERLWGGLNLWLERSDGAHGLPTAFALGHRHVGLAVSQALVREADRRRLRTFFLQFDLPPRSVVPPAELEVMIDVWINALHSTAGASLTTLWRISANRSTICEIAATELAEWTGEFDQPTPGRRAEQRARLVLMRAPGLRPRIQLSVVVPDRGEEPTARVRSAAGGTAPLVPLEPFRDGLSLLGESDTFSPADLLEGLLSLEVTGIGDVRRIPRRVVVLKHDDLTNTWIESVRVLLGDSLRLLVHRDRLEDVRRALSEMARPGWCERADIDGLPGGWIEFSDVEIFGRPTTPIYSSSDLAALVPATTRQLQLGAGMKVPGKVRNRWHVRRAPELRAVSDATAGFSIRLLDLGLSADETAGEVELERWASDESNSVVVDLAGCDLTIGDYVLVMQEDGSKEASQRLSFSLRSSAMPDLQSQREAVRFEHSWDSVLAVIGADGPDDDPRSEVRGWVLAPLEDRPWWRRTLREKRAASIGLERPPQDSCFYTGRHREKVDTVQLDSRNRPLSPTTIGRCVECGVERVYSNDYWKLRKAKERADAAAVFAAPRGGGGARPAVRAAAQGGASWDIALDLLVYFGGGDFDLLRRIASEVEDGSAFALQFARTLEGLGHISVRRTRADLAPTIWHVNEPVLYASTRGTALIGAWSASEIDKTLEVGASRVEESDPDVPATRLFRGVTSDVMERAGLSRARRLSRPARALLERSAALSEVLPELHRVPPPSTLHLERFDPPSASWMPTIDSSTVGAYRTTGRQRSYLLRTDSDLHAGTAAVADPYTAKHVASVLLTGKALAAYASGSRELVCPVGANLPALYDHAVVSETQRPPFIRHGYLIYADVEPEVAARIGHLLTH